MDLRKYNLSTKQIDQAKKFIVSRKLLYQPFIITDELEVGEGKNYHDGYSKPTANVYWPDAPPEMRDLCTDDLQHFRNCNAYYRALYDHFIECVVRSLGGDVSRRAFAELGCNAGYFLHGLGVHGAKACYGFDFTENTEVFEWFNRFLGTRSKFQFAEWDSLKHRLRYARMPIVDVVLCSAFLNHVSDPTFCLAFLCDHAREAVFIWTPLSRHREQSCPMPHWESDSVLSFGQPSYHPNALEWPLCFNFNLRFSEPFLKLCLQLAGFEDIREVPCPPVSARWGEIYSTFKAFLAFRTKSKTSALSGGKAIRDLPGDVRKSTLFLKRLVRSVT